MTDNEAASHCEENKVANKSTDETYEKLTGAAGAEGHFLEINLLTLCKLRGDQQLKDFFLAGNLDSAGDFHDVIFRCVDEKGIQNIIFLHSKFKQQDKKNSISIEIFKCDHDLPLQKYFKSFMKIQNEFNKSGSNDPIFGGKTDNLNCYFVIYTNAHRHDDMEEHVVKVENPLSFVLGETNGKACRLKVDKAKELLQGVEHYIEIEQVLKHMKQITTEKCDSLQADNNFKIYHAFFTQTVFVQPKPDGSWKYRNDFVEGYLQNEFLKKLRQKTFSWYKDEMMGVKKSDKKNLCAYEIIKHMKECNFKLPAWFENATPKLCETVCDEFIKIATQCITDNICTISKMSKKVMNEVTKYVGNVLVFDEDKAMFKFNTKQIDEEPRKILEYLTKQLNTHNIDPNVYFDIQVENFPRLSLGFTKIDSKKNEEFVEKLRILTGQPDGDSLKKMIQRNFGSLNDEEVGRHHQIIGKITDWWKKSGETKYLRKDDGFFEGILNGILFNLTSPIQSFTGRTKELANLHAALRTNESGDRTVVVSQMASAGSLGRIGKTEFARQYAHLYGHTYDGNIIWVDAETQEKMGKCFRRLCTDYLKISTQDANNKEIEVGTIVEKVYSFFQERKSLFIFDNAQYFKSNATLINGIDNFLPATTQNMTMAHFLITSRNQEWQCPVRIELGALQYAEAEQLVKGLLEIKDDQQDNDIKELIQQMWNSPLTLQLAVADIRQQQEVYSKKLGRNYMISDYLKSYKDLINQFIICEIPDDSYDEYTTDIMIPWDINFAEIEDLELQKGAWDILNIMAYLNPNDIPVKFFADIVDNDLEKLKHLFSLIQEKCSMITLCNGLANFHRVLQSNARLMIQDAGLQNDVLKQALSIIGKHTDHHLIAQGVSVWNYSNQDGDLVTEFNTIPAQIIEALRETLRYEEACAFGKASLETLKSKIGHGHIATLTAQSQLAKTLFQLGKYEDALNCYTQLHKERLKILGPDHPDTSTTQNDMAGTLFHLGQYAEALGCYKEVFENRTNTLGPNHPDSLTAENDIARTLFHQGLHEGALRCYKQLFEKRTKTLGPDHPETLTTENNIARTLFYQGQYEDALSCYKDVYEKRTKTLGPVHIETLATENAIAKTLSEKGEYNEALSSFKKVNQKMSTAFGSNHKDTLATENDIAKTLFRQGQYEVALSCYREVFEKRINIMGPYHPHTFTTENDIAKTLCKLKQYEAALSTYEKVIRKMNKLLEPNHPDILATKNCIADTLSENGQYAKALSIYKKVLQKMTKILGPNHPNTLATENDMAKTLSRQGQYERALRSYKKVIQKMIKTLGPNHKDTLATANYIADTLLILGQYEDALSAYKEILEKKRIVLGLDHPDTLATENAVADILFKLGQYEEALCSYIEVFENRTKVLGPSHVDTLKTQMYIADTLSQFYLYEEALSFYREVLDKTTEIFGSSHLDTITTANRIADILSRQRKNEEAETAVTQKEITNTLSQQDNL